MSSSLLSLSGHRTLIKMFSVSLIAFLSNVPTSIMAEHVMELQTGNWDAHMKSGERYFIKFFAPWCAHCKKMAPAWEALAKQVSAGSSSYSEVPLEVRVAEVDCTKHADVCSRVGIKGYPTLLYVNRRGEIFTYSGSTEVEKLLAFLLRQIEEEEGIGSSWETEKEATENASESNANEQTEQTSSDQDSKFFSKQTFSSFPELFKALRNWWFSYKSSERSKRPLEMSIFEQGVFELVERLLPGWLINMTLDSSKFIYKKLRGDLVRLYLGKFTDAVCRFLNVAYLVVIEVGLYRVLNKCSPFRMPTGLTPNTDAYDQEEEMVFIRNIYFFITLFVGFLYWQVNRVCYATKI